MGKKTKSQSDKAVKAKDSKKSETTTSNALPFLSGKSGVDPTLASLFETSAGPVKAPTVPANPKPVSKDQESDDADDVEEVSDLVVASGDEDEDMEDVSDEQAATILETSNSEAPSRKRKRGTANDNLEDAYMHRVAKEEEKEAEKRRAEKQSKRQKTDEEDSEDKAEESADDSNEEDGDSDVSDDVPDVPKHESVAGTDAQSREVEKSKRTVFLGNVSTQAIKSKSAKKTLLRHLASFLATLPESTGPHKVESIRFRSTAFASGGGVPKRASFARKELLDETTPSTNAYAVYTSIQAARKAPAALNGTVVLDRHLRVDSIAHPSEIDHKRCVFVGNLDFVDLESADPQDDKKRKKQAAPADIEEGLWRTFNANTSTGGSKEDAASSSSGKGHVESVRVVRDRGTRVGKGFAYVQFYDENCVESALLLDGKKFPPMLPRKLRVTRAKKMRRDNNNNNTGSGPGPRQKVLGVGTAHKTLQGRATKLFGRAGAAQMKRGDAPGSTSFVFEGHRASEGSSRIKAKTKSRGSRGKPKNRSSQRAAAYKAAGGKKTKST
ncbi:hypothetical protein ASPZODRAFT_67069 [Penicilliopsis zonata CBS 506.65]|uniref:Nucleolar protein 12 n=1 Tax=Penicilliopsis zonata CBS 506.65 TaxID=1073090 RepID=A0A1L9SGH6_9EURO|nr:hypothetical protein ASPZODRAFT_67069 [Penicilliopsis zonata CBS 506.65]OJJ46272.1 hypothetical protein ASPZODRAFT_67069 [Penicilliopsis zonata CBS 506.65]